MWKISIPPDSHLFSLRLCLDQGFGEEKKMDMEMEMEKVDDSIVQNGWIIYLFHFHHQILDPPLDHLPFPFPFPFPSPNP